ncbi:MAG: arsenate reductase [Bacteroidota bacterium]
MKVYGIPNCDVIKKVLDWFKVNNIDYEFHDYKKDGISQAKLISWVKQVGLEIVLNKRSTTWRELTTEEQESASEPAAAIALMVNNTSLIKRPVIESGDKVVMVGFNQTQYDQKLKNL